ncbi:hypothetical protein ACHAW5_010364 [Stephanodiscus triporus]|uniref:MARVEL domain-containing protein n=1 Tax=Stephanodiscus triporus TaxID=2934178 RepID=A0ABD3N8N4_9STRA
MGRSDYSTEASSQADGTTYVSDSADKSSYGDGDFTHYSSHAGGKGGGDGIGGAPGKTKKVSVSGLNRRLRTEYIDVDPNDDSVGASLIRGIVGLVGSCFTPRQILVALRLLKAVTVAFVALDGAANLVYVACVEFVADDGSSPYFGHRRDTVLRLYGALIGTLALLIELDKFVMKNFKVLKGFIARFGLLFFVATVTYCHPSDTAGVPSSAVIFQMVSSCVLACCSFAYLVFGLLCLDRFTSRAFLSTQDPVASTAIPSAKNKYDAPNLT